MSDTLDQYVTHALALSGFELDASSHQRVALEFSRIAAIAATLDEAALGVHDEPLPVYRA